MKPIIAIDVETTGLDCNKNMIIELAAIYKSGDKKDIFHCYCLPPRKPRGFKVIEELTGITWGFLKQNGIDEKTMYDKFIKWLNSLIDKYDKNDKAVFAAFNAPFDKGFVMELLCKYGDREYNGSFGCYFYSANLDVSSTVALGLCRGVLQPLENYKNKTVCDELGIKLKAHSAIEDIKASMEVHRIIMSRIIGEHCLMQPGLFDAKKKAAKKKAKKESGVSGKEINECLKFYSEKFEQVSNGDKPNITQGRDRAILTRLIKNYGVDKVKEATEKFFNDAYAKKCGYTISVLSYLFNSLILQDKGVSVDQDERKTDHGF